MFLEQLGADARVFSQFEFYASAGCVLGRVATSVFDEYRVYAETAQYRAEPSGGLLYGALTRAELPVAGDWVAMRAIAAEEEAIVQAVLPRRTTFSRRAAGGREDEQVLAANVDTALIVCGLDGDFNARRIERYLTLAHASGVEPVVVLSKADVCPDLDGKVDEARSIARGKPVVAISSVTGEGIAPLTPLLVPGRTFVLLGSSGAGKSTLLNRLLGEERLLTGAVRESDGRGRHTTTHRELVLLPSGAALIDTPGLRELQLWANRDSLDETFDEIAELAVQCRFRDCSHVTEAGCAVRRAVESGNLDPSRWENYRKLQGEIRRHEMLANRPAALAEKQRWKSIHKAQRAHNKERGKWHNSW